MVLAAAWPGAVEHVRRARAISKSEVVDDARSDRGYRPPQPLDVAEHHTSADGVGNPFRVDALRAARETRRREPA